MSAWTVIRHQELASNEANITFSNIPQTYTDLILVYSLRTTLGGFNFDDMSMRINGDTSSVYTNRTLRAREGTMSALSGTDNRLAIYEACASAAPANSFGNGQIYIPNYALSGTKRISSMGYSIASNSNLQGGLVSGLWAGNAAVTSISLFSANGQNLVQYSSATLYGITSGSSGGVTVG
jgi:hypothetical protein